MYISTIFFYGVFLQISKHFIEVIYEDKCELKVVKIASLFEEQRKKVGD